MSRTALPLLLLPLGAGCVPPAGGLSDSGDGLDTGDAAEDLRAETIAPGDPGAPGPYPVGIATRALPGSDPEALVEIWYPAASADFEPTTYDVLGVTLPAGGGRDVAPEPTAPAFVVAFSHGLGGVRQQNYSMAERLASHGFVVVAPDHPGTTTVDFASGFDDLEESVLARPGTLSAAVDLVLDGAIEGLRPRGGTYAAVGHSLGSLTVLALGGAVMLPEQYNELCAGDPRPNVCALVSEMELTNEEVAAAISPDPRVSVSVLQAPLAHFAMEAGSVGAVPMPMLMGGERDNPDGSIVPCFELTGDDAVMVLYDDAGHNAATDICDIPVASSIAPECAGPEEGWVEPDEVRALAIAHTVAWLGASLGGEPSFADAFGPGEGFSWETH